MAEAGLQKAIAELKNNMAWREDTTGVETGDMVIRNITAEYTANIYDTSKDATLPGGHIRLVSEGVFQDSRQTVESIIRFLLIRNLKRIPLPPHNE